MIKILLTFLLAFSINLLVLKRITKIKVIAILKIQLNVNKSDDKAPDFCFKIS